jgi:tRNA-dihydrouridine synthase
MVVPSKHTVLHNSLNAVNLNMIPILTPRTALQVAGGQPEHISKIAKLLENETSSDFVDLNCGCPLDTICNR